MNVIKYLWRLTFASLLSSIFLHNTIWHELLWLKGIPFSIALEKKCLLRTSSAQSHKEIIPKTCSRRTFHCSSTARVCKSTTRVCRQTHQAPLVLTTSPQLASANSRHKIILPLPACLYMCKCECGWKKSVAFETLSWKSKQSACCKSRVRFGVTKRYGTCWYKRFSKGHARWRLGRARCCKHWPRPAPVRVQIDRVRVVFWWMCASGEPKAPHAAPR